MGPDSLFYSGSKLVKYHLWQMNALLKLSLMFHSLISPFCLSPRLDWRKKIDIDKVLSDNLIIPK